MTSLIKLVSTEQHSMKEDKNRSLSLDPFSGETKQQGLISELLRLIQDEMQEGEHLPSVNSVSRELKLSRDTVFKAYQELKKRRIIKSTPNKGYFVNKELNRVLLLLDYYSPFKDLVYQEIEKKVGQTHTIDLVFHHYNQTLFDTVILNSIGKYDVFLVMNFDIQEFKISETLKRIDPAKLLLLDIPVFDWLDFDAHKYSWVCQNFEQAVIDALDSIRHLTKKYTDFIFLNPDRLKHPAVSLQAFCKFCIQNEIKPHVLRASSELEVKRGEAYFIFRQHDLTHILRLAKEKKLEPGKDFGVIAYNDIPLYEFVGNGITVISTDFRKIGQMAADFIIDRENVQETVPTKVIIRK